MKDFGTFYMVIFFVDMSGTNYNIFVLYFLLTRTTKTLLPTKNVLLYMFIVYH
jgi:hypothetical protein